ncbi:GEVED domain-containing protein [Sanyastnella coralliicola]|uniref:GEVED domain-containing protein n=1 Tax=Sanyastnella coralliicola TaxID=3069118 RepID=UPI0027B8F2DB|nr:GEVED domain-containing protein [Longitalea sp. SCSIO 12813]
MNTTLIRWKQSAMIAFLSLMGLFAFTSNLTAQYCESDGGDGYPNIESITFGDIYNYSGDNDGYGDFTDLSTDLEVDSYNDIVLNPGGPWWIRFRWTAWIDYDQNGTFDEDELVVHQSGYGNEYASIYVPEDALGGETRLRISMDAYHFQGPCAHFNYGEVEDYTVNINGGCEAFAGTLTAVESMVCSNGMNTISATANGDAMIPEGYSSVFVLTQGEGLVIVNAGAEPSFEVAEPGLYTIHTLVYDAETLDLGIVELGVTTGFDVFGLIAPGGGSICADLDVAGAPIMVQNPDAGTLSGGGEACAAGGAAALTATPNGDANVPSGYSTVYVLTQGDGLTIINAGAEPSFDVTEAGNYTIHTLVYNPETLDLGIVELGVTTGFDVNGLLVQGGGAICASLDVPGAAFNVVAPSAGTLTAVESMVCSNGMNTISAIANGDAMIPEGYSSVFVLTQGEGLVIVNAGAEPSFEVAEPGLYTIHTLVYDAETLDLGIVELGVTTGFDVFGLIAPGGGSICADLDVAGAPIMVQNPDAGTLSGGDEACAAGGAATLTATPNGDANVPSGYSTVYVLTQGDGLTIINAGAEPSFEVTEAGNYTIHTLVYNPETLDLGIVELGVTTGFDVNGLLVQGGGAICASLDVPGAAFNVVAPSAGTLTAVESMVCSNGMNTISATANGDAMIPEGYSSVFVLTQGEGLVIVNAGAEPSFEVTEPGLYTIHTLVYDAETLDLGIVELGVTTGFDVFGLIAPGGGSVCADLDVAGAPIMVQNPDAGTLSGGGEACLAGGSAALSATPNGDANVPSGYSTVYVLTQGDGLTIINAGAEPSFEVTEAGNYTIHTLVYNPETLDLGIVETGVTTGFDVNGLLVQGGGAICASLDVPGAAFSVVECACVADAGSLVADASTVCSSGVTTISASTDQMPFIPEGYAQVYVLTQGDGLVIVNAGAEPSFEVEGGGLYTIHSLVFDPTTLDLGIVELGVTTGFDVNGLLIQGGGEICASLDVAGAPVVIENPSAGTLYPENFLNCLSDEPTVLTAVADGDAIVPEGYELLYVLTNAYNLTILDVNSEPTFEVTQFGFYRIHTLVYNPETLNLGAVELGVTTGFDVNDLLTQGGGEVCGSLDVYGALLIAVDQWICDFLWQFFRGDVPTDPRVIEQIITEYDLQNGPADLFAINVYPNPTVGNITLQVDAASTTNAQLEIYDVTGRVVKSMQTLQFAEGSNSLELDLSQLETGNYVIRLITSNRALTTSFIKE